MKRAMLILGAVALAACSPNPPQRTAGEAETTREWVRPPAVEAVERAGSTLKVSGVADPEGRVVLRGDDGAAFAATADSHGRFEVQVPAAATHRLLRPEAQVGQDAAPSPDLLLILADQGPVAVLRSGGATRRLDPAPALGAIDGDGRMRLASGRVAAGTAVVEVQSGPETIQVTPDGAGRWSVILPARGGPDPIRVDGREFVWPGEAAGAGPLTVEQMEGGWRIGWSGAGGARQTTWLPVRTAPGRGL